MCGISILIDRTDGPVSADLIHAMNDKVIHRGPNDEGYYYGRNFAFGHRRLSVVDTTSAGHQPMQKSDDCIVYNGMLYNYIELKAELANAGYHFVSQTDTEVILAAWQYWSFDAFKRFKGMWAFAIYDNAMQKIIFCRDHFGIKPLYYTSVGTSFAAGSEIKQFTVLPGFEPVLNSRVAINFLAKGNLNYSDQTFFTGVCALQAGHYLQYNLQAHTMDVQKWYDLEKAVVPVTDDLAKATATVSGLFRASIKMHMRADVTVGSCLSGGLDSSSIVSAVHQQKSANNLFSTFTSCYADLQYDEQRYSDVVTEKTGFASIKVFPALDQMFSAGHFDSMLYSQDQPFSSASHYSEFNVFKSAGEHGMTVMLDGQGSDEYFCGYPEFFTVYMTENFRSHQFAHFFRELWVGKYDIKNAARVIKELLQAKLIYPFLTKTKRLLGRRTYDWMNAETEGCLQPEIKSYTSDNVRDLSIQQLLHSSIPYQLHSEDRNSMMFGIESRLPFLDHHLVEYVLGLPAHFKINHGFSKFILRKVMPELPDAVRWRKDKLGFAAPDKEWMLQNHVLVRNELESALVETPFFSAALLTRFDKFVNGTLGYEPIYFRAMALVRFCRIFHMQIPTLK